jgi:LacI family transcriptional regulator
LFVQGDFGFGSGDAAARRLLRLPDRVTAIIGSNDQMTLAALDVAREFGLRVPDDLSLVSFDNTPIVRFTLPALTAVDQPIAATASRAVELIIEAQRGGPLPTEPVVVPASLVRRQSTGRVPDRPS